MEAAAVAKALGRTLILPRFQAWAGDRSSSANTTVPFETTFDTAALRRYLPVVTVDALRRFLIGERTHTLLALTGLDESKFLRAQQLPCCPRRKRAHSEPLRSAALARATRELSIITQRGLASLLLAAEPRPVAARTA